MQDTFIFLLHPPPIFLERRVFASTDLTLALWTYSLQAPRTRRDSDGGLGRLWPFFVHRLAQGVQPVGSHFPGGSDFGSPQGCLVLSVRLCRLDSGLTERTEIQSRTLIFKFCSYDDEDDDGSSSYTLTFNFTFPHNGDRVYFAHCFPYTYTQLQEFLLAIQVSEHLLSIMTYPILLSVSQLAFYNSVFTVKL